MLIFRGVQPVCLSNQSLHKSYPTRERVPGISSKNRKANFTSCCVKGRRKSPEVAEVLANVRQRCKVGPGSSYKWSYNPYKWPYNWVTGVTTLVIGVITQVITGRGPILWSKRRSCVLLLLLTFLLHMVFFVSEDDV